MKTFQEFIVEAAPVSQAMKGVIHPDLHTNIERTIKDSEARVKYKGSNEHDVKDKLHAHLTSLGYKRNPTMSDAKSSEYAHTNGDKVHLNHYSGNTLVFHKLKK